MKKSSYIKSKEGGFVVVFLSIMVAFALILSGLNMEREILYMIGFFLILCAMLYAPIRKYVIDRPREKK